ncbi:MAG: hypothetical protein KKF52_00025 [Nanoarchaeota archaeon]|nr:hypothetical protein [Nanoarchaeota archaeon]
MDLSNLLFLREDGIPKEIKGFWNKLKEGLKSVFKIRDSMAFFLELEKDYERYNLLMKNKYSNLDKIMKEFNWKLHNIELKPASNQQHEHLVVKVRRVIYDNKKIITWINF